jgi:hypothetical protein
VTHQEFAAILVAFIIGFLLIGAAFVLWGGHDKRLDDHDGELAVLKAALNLGGQPLAVTDPPVSVDTKPQPKVDVAGGLRTQVAAAREANRPKPTPFPRKQGRHAA